MATVNFYLKDRHTKSETLIYVYFHFDGKAVKISTGEKIKPLQWSFEAQRAKKNYPGSVEFNAKLDAIEGKLKAEYRLSTGGVSLTKESVKKTMVAFIRPNQRQSRSLLDFLTEFMVLKRATTKPNTIKKFVSLYNHLSNFQSRKNYEVSFENMDLKFYERFRSYLITDIHHLNNSVGKYIAALKSFLHWATESGYNSNQAFKKFKVIKDNADIIYLTEAELMRLYEFDFKNERLEKVRDAFCFSCFTGLRHGDIARVKHDSIKDDEIHIKAAKTRDDLIIPLSSYAKEILIKYDYRLPETSNQKTNAYLKEIGQAAGITDPVTLTKYSGTTEIQLREPKYKFLTSHVARRTFVTLSLEKGMRPEIVMSITGHKDYEVFKRYIKLTSQVKKIEMKKVWEKKTVLKKVE